MGDDQKKEDDKKDGLPSQEAAGNTPGSNTTVQATGPSSARAAAPQGGVPGASGKVDEDFEAQLQEFFNKHPEAAERILAKHPTLVQLEKLAAELKAAGTTRVSGNVVASNLSPIEQSVWEDVARISTKIREAKAKNPDMWRVEASILTPPPMDVIEARERTQYLGSLQRVLRTINGIAKPPAAYEASLTTATSGAAFGVDSATPAVVIPTQYPAQLRDTTIFGTIPQGADRKRFQLIKAYAMGALTESTEPTQLTDALSSIDVLTTERGGEKAISFIEQRKNIGPIDDAVILAMRLGELYDEDTIMFGGLGVSGISGLSDISLTTPGDGNLIHLAGLQYGDGTVAADNTITSTMVMKEAYLATAVQKITAQGYDPSGLVAVMSPKQFRDLIEDSNIVRFVQWWYGDQANAYIAQGFIPDLHGIEIRRSTLVPTVTITSSGTGYECYIYKKQFSVAMAATQDVVVESFRDVRKNETVYKTHYQLGTNIIAANSVFRLDTA